MTISMDSDCLIKLTKAGLKEMVCSAWQICIPELVQQECVERTPQLPDAARIGENIDRGRITVRGAPKPNEKGEEAVLQLYVEGNFDAVATDDVRFIRRLRALGVRFVVPAVILVRLCRDRTISMEQTRQALAQLRPYISADEHATAELMLGGG